MSKLCLRTTNITCLLPSMYNVHIVYRQAAIPPNDFEVHCALSGENRGDIASLFLPFVWFNFQLISLAAMTRGEGTITYAALLPAA